ncbi:hypothetical protein [Rhizobium leguminosarum]
MSSALPSEKEFEVFSTEEGRRRALAMIGQPDPFKDVPPSLLSADDIDRYIRKTGLISPYHEGGGKDERLKKASYEGRIGDSAYKFNEDGLLVPILTRGKALRVPANTIVFVESNLEFRLPDYIALRFNLTIRHVHRGLLLGTGPLVDPGFWGKLCIPLHNLTDQDYEIPADEGLIWVEFTKTTSTPKAGRKPVPSETASNVSSPNPGVWDITTFIEKAARQFKSGKPSIAIRSSIPLIALQNSKNAEEAAREAKKAKDDAAESKRSSHDAKAALELIKAKVESYGLIGVLLSLATAFGIWASFYFGVRTDIAAINARLDSAITDENKVTDSTKAGSPRQLTPEERLFSDVENLRRRLDEVVRENATLKSQLQNTSSAQKP